MTKLRSITFTISSLSLWLILSSWGSVGHHTISGHAAASFPAALNFLRDSWSVTLVDYCMVPDQRKQWDDTESPKHYIDIDNYNEFNLYGKIPMTRDSVNNLHGISFVLNNGTIPWATIATFDSIKACFKRNDFYQASMFAADLGHYVGDGHNPLHITKNYDGDDTNQHGIHSRYETHMVGDYSNDIVYSDDTAELISDVPGFIFTYLYYNYQYVDSILLADQYAVSVAGNTNSTAYYQALWDRTGTFTTALFKHASWSLASLIYTAWVEAGSPNAIPRLAKDPSILGQNTPDPFQTVTTIPIEIQGSIENVTLKVFDSSGKLVTTLVDGRLTKGSYRISWDGSGNRSGIYFYTLQSGDAVMTRKMVLVK
ncbi:MAG: T9SS type A sorting domain-containing protein [Bacteroidetes bacterium]|nr:T9SS type A sorting domain-containing protein [Bacteroidota bacterium]